MTRNRKWNIEQLDKAVKNSFSVREVIKKLNLIPAGGNYAQINKFIKQHNLPTKHFTGMLWSKGKKLGPRPIIKLENILVNGSSYQSFKLKKRLFSASIKKPKCEICGWAKKSIDGRIPLELDHVNGNRNDNRIENLRILCPNCHSLQTTHRGKNKNRPSGGTGIHARLKIL